MEVDKKQDSTNFNLIIFLILIVVLYVAYRIYSNNGTDEKKSESFEDYKNKVKPCSMCSALRK